jgi:DNA-binding YbaB/EbfC family protein
MEEKMFDKMKQMMEMQKKARELQRELANSKVESSRMEGRVMVVMSADYKVHQINIDPGLLLQDNKQRLESAIKEAFQDALKKVQDIAVQKMKSITGNVDLGSFLK